jgi:hypothetical protein
MAERIRALHEGGHNKGPSLLNEYGECDVPAYVTPEGRAVYATHRNPRDNPSMMRDRVFLPARTAPLKASAINPENIPDPDPDDYNDQGRFIRNPAARLMRAIAQLQQDNKELSEDRIYRHNGDKFTVGSLERNGRHDKWGVKVMT